MDGPVPETLVPIRRIVTGHDRLGRSKVISDGDAPSVKSASMGRARGHTDIWVRDEVPVPLSADPEMGDRPYVFPGPPEGGHFRVVQAQPRASAYDPANDPDAEPPHESRLREGGRAWDRGGRNAFSSGMHKTQSIDYGILLQGERDLILDDARTTMRPGDVIVQVGAWHQWSNPRMGAIMAFDMNSTEFEADQTLAVPPQPGDSARALSSGRGEVRRPRRIVTGDTERGRSSVIVDGPSPDLILDAARPGFASSRIWVAEGWPPPLTSETLRGAQALTPPPNGSTCRISTYPPDASWIDTVTEHGVRAFFSNAGSPEACTYSPDGRHPYMQKTETLEFQVVISGEIVLVLDLDEVTVGPGAVIVQRGTSHAIANRSAYPAQVAIISHAGRF